MVVPPRVHDQINSSSSKCHHRSIHHCNAILSFLELWPDFQRARFLQEINHGIMILAVRAHHSTVPPSPAVLALKSAPFSTSSLTASKCDLK